MNKQVLTISIHYSQSNDPERLHGYEKRSQWSSMNTQHQSREFTDAISGSLWSVRSGNQTQDQPLSKQTLPLSY